MITHETIDRIMTTARIEEVVGDFVNLKRRGVNMLGLCPFHNEKTPSFTVSPAKGIYKCFGCGKAGNSVNFIMDHESLGYPEALRYLADKYHIEIEETAKAAEETEAKTERDSMYILMGAAQKYYTLKLNEDEEGRTIALSYLKERQLRPDIIERFQLGWSSSGRDDFSKWAINNGYSKEYLVKTGMSFETDSGLLLDRYRERVMFPIHNISGKIVGFGGRILKNNAKEAKYINSPETDIYNKSKILYGLFQARKAIRQKDECLIVEGYMDVISLHQAGIEHAAASSGTSLTEDQLRLVKRFTDNVTFLFDGDAAGQKAALRAIDMALEQELNVRMLLLPPEHDPDTFVKAYDTEYVEQYFKDHSESFISFRRKMVTDDFLRDPLKKAEMTHEMLVSISLIKDLIKQNLYIRQVTELFSVDENTLNLELKRIAASKFKKENKAPDLQILPESPEEKKLREFIPDKDSTRFQEKMILKMLLLYGTRIYTDDQTVAQYIFRETMAMEWESADCRHVFEKYRRILDAGGNLDMNMFMMDEPEEMRSFVYDLTTEKYALSPGWEEFLKRPIPAPDSMYKDDVKSAMGYLKYAKITKIVQNNSLEAARAISDEAMDELLMLQNHLLKMRLQLARELGIG